MLSTYKVSRGPGSIELAVSAAVAGEAGIGPALGWDRDTTTPVTAEWALRLLKMTESERRKETAHKKQVKSATDVETPDSPRIEDVARPKPPDTEVCKKPTKDEDAETNRRAVEFWLGRCRSYRGRSRGAPGWGGTPGTKSPGGE